MKRALVAAAAAVLLAPAAASAHPGIYAVTQKVAPAGCFFPTTGCLTDTTQYAVANDGWAAGFTENNAVAGGGMINYKYMPGNWRSGDSATNVPEMTPEQKRTYAPAQTDLQAHATCSGTPLDNGPNILAWQDKDPFFNYVPFQSTSANLGDQPSKWIPVVKAATGVDLTGMTADQAAAACAGIGGTYHKADASSVIDTATVKAQTDPLNSMITTLQTGQTTLAAAKAASDAAAAAAEAARQALVARPLTLTLASTKFSAAVVMVTGAAGTPVTVTLKHASQPIGAKTVSLGAQGAALLTVKSHKKIKKNTSVTVLVSGGGKTASRKATLTK